MKEGKFLFNQALRKTGHWTSSIDRWKGRNRIVIGQTLRLCVPGDVNQMITFYNQSWFKAVCHRFRATVECFWIIIWLHENCEGLNHSMVARNQRHTALSHDWSTNSRCRGNFWEKSNSCRSYEKDLCSKWRNHTMFAWGAEAHSVESYINHVRSIRVDDYLSIRSFLPKMYSSDPFFNWL